MPIYEHMIATEPLADQIWEEVGRAERGLFGACSRMFTYAQRTADNRIAIGGRDFGYRFGSAIDARLGPPAVIVTGRPPSACSSSTVTRSGGRESATRSAH